MNKCTTLGLSLFSLIGLQAGGITLGEKPASLSLTVVGNEVQAKLSSSAMVDFAVGPYVWRAMIDGVEENGLKYPQIKALDKRTVLVTGKLGPLEVEQRFVLLEHGQGFSETLRLHNPTGQDVDMAEFRTGFSRQVNPETDPYRLVAVPYRRQADGSFHDYSMKDVANLPKGTRLNSESWILTDAKNGLLVLKYDNEAVEESAVDWIKAEHRLIFGGCAYVLKQEPVQANRIEAGGTFCFGDTRYVFYQGGWPEGYTIYKAYINSKGHGLTEDYDPQVQWNILYDLGCRDWSHAAVLAEAALAKEVGCTRIYFDPGWQVPDPHGKWGRSLWGSALWDEKRLGPLDALVKCLKDSYGLELGLWTVSRGGDHYDNQWPREYFRKVPMSTNGAPKVLDGHRNLALLPAAKANASSVFRAGQMRAHQISHLNDGVYGNAASWVADQMPAWAEIDLGADYLISEVALSNDNTQEHTDRAPKSFRVFTATRYNPDSKADAWTEVASYRQFEAPLTKRMAFPFVPITTRWVRVELLEPQDNPVRIDEIEVFEAAKIQTSDVAKREEGNHESLQTLNELCMSCAQWRDERLCRLSRLADAGVKFLMFDFHAWNGPCCATNHGHPVPSTSMDHIHTIYGIARKLRQEHPGLRIEMHDGIRPWGRRYLPSYFRQGLKDGDYDENWAYEFMWNSIEDIRSGKAMCLYYYNLAYDIPMYLHFNMHADNDQCLVFWWMASTVRHIGFGGRTDVAHMHMHGPLPKLTPEQAQQRFDHYKAAMVTYNRFKRYFTHGEFVGIGGDETLHLHTLPDRPGGVLMVFNLTDKPVARIIRVPLNTLNLKTSSTLPVVTGAEGRVVGQDLVLSVKLDPESPALIEIGTSAGVGASRSQEVAEQ